MEDLKHGYKLEEGPMEEVIDGEIVYNVGSNLASADPFVYGRLMKQGKYKEAKAMANTKMYRVLLPNGEYQ